LSQNKANILTAVIPVHWKILIGHRAKKYKATNKNSLLYDMCVLVFNRVLVRVRGGSWAVGKRVPSPRQKSMGKRPCHLARIFFWFFMWKWRFWCTSAQNIEFKGHLVKI